MTLEAVTSIAEVIASIGVLVSLIFVGYQYRQHSHLIERGEQNSTMSEWSKIRMAIVENPGVAELWDVARSGDRDLTAAEALRVNTFLEEHLWAAYHIWDRTERGLFQHGRFDEAAGPLVASLLSTEHASAWWTTARGIFPKAFVADVDSALARFPAASGAGGRAREHQG